MATATAMRAGAAYIELQARSDRLMSDVQRGARQAGLQAGQTLSRSMSERVASLSSSMQEVGSQLTASMTLPVAAAGTAVIKLGADYEYQMARVRNISQATGSDFDMMNDQAKDLGASTQFSATQAAEGMEYLAMAGFKPKEIYEALPSVLNGASAANMQLGDTANIVSNIMTGYGIAAENASQATDILTAASQSGNVDVEGLGESFKYGGSMAKMAGLSVEEAAAAFTLMGNAGMQGSMGGTAVGAALRSMMKPSQAAQQQMDALGLSFHDAQGNMRALPDIIDDVGKSGMTNEQFLQIFGTEGGRAMSALAEQGSDSMRDLTESLEGASGTTDAFAADMSETAKAGFQGFKSAVEGLAIAISESGALDGINKLVRAATELIRGLSETNPAVLKWGFTLAVAAAAIGPTIKILGLLFGWTTRLGPAFGMVSRATTGTVGALGRLAGGFRSAQVASSAFSGRMGSIGGALRRGVSAITAATTRITVAVARAATQFAVHTTRMVVSAATSLARISAQFALAAARGMSQFIAAMVRVAVTTIAQFVRMAARAVIWAATMAAQWLIAMGPVGWVIAAVVGLVVAIVANWDKIQAATAIVWDWIWGKIQGIANFIVNLFLNWTIVGAVIQHWDSIWAGTQRVWNAVVAWVKAIPSRIVGFFLNWTLPGLIIKHWGSIKSGTQRVAGQMLAYVKSIPGKILGFFGNFGTMLYGKGKDLIRGLWNGIKSMGSWIKNKIMSFAKNMIPGPVAEALGIHSPSRVMRDQIGRWIPPGIVDGIDKASPELDAAMRDLVSLPAIPELSPLSVSSDTPTGATAQPVRTPALTDRAGVTVHVQSQADPHEIGREVAWSLRTSDR